MNRGPSRAWSFESQFAPAARPVTLVDVTLRDGEQTAGVVFANTEKIRIACLLSEIGIHEIETGSVWICPEEREAISQISALDLPARSLGFCRADQEDIVLAKQCGVDIAVISASTSEMHVERKYGRSRQWVLDQVREAADAARDLVLPFIVSAEDASRTNLDFLLAYAVQAEELGASRFRFCDSLSTLDPFGSFQLIQSIRQAVSLDVEVHCHNDFGMATANSLAGYRAGAAYITVSVNGLGERTGNAALEEVVMALRYLDGLDLGIATPRFREVSEYVARASSRAIPVWKAIVGANVFAHESGVHVDGVIKNPITYEAFSPDEVGLQRQLVIGKHSGSRAIQHKFREFSIELSDDEATAILQEVRRIAVDLKRALFDKELVYIYQDLVERGEVHA